MYYIFKTYEWIFSRPLKLEKENPTKSPVHSLLLNGVWELVFSGFGSPGLIFYQISKYLNFDFIEIGALTVTISRVQPRVEASSSVKV